MKITNQLYRNIFSKSIQYLFITTHLLIFLLCIFSFKIINAYKLYISNYNVFLLGISIISVLLGFKLSRYFKYNRKTVLALSAFLFFIQLFLIFHYYFYTDWDVQELLKNAIALSDKNFSELNNFYFSRYPNNILLTVFFSKIFTLFNGLLGQDFAYVFLLVIQSILNVLSGFLILKVTLLLTKSEKYAFFSYWLYLLILWISPWVVIPYSDSMGLIFPILMYYIYTHPKMHYILKSVLLSAIGIIGYSVKPQIAIMIIAIIMVSLLTQKIEMKPLIAAIIAIFVVSFPMFFAINRINSTAGFALDYEWEMTYHHFIKMGLNSETDGGYLSNDVGSSISIENKEERVIYNKQIIAQRIKNYGVTGLINHQAKKTLNNYNDGTFGWGLEGSFFEKIFPNDSYVAKITRSFYYSSGKLHLIFQGIVQSIWLSILFLVLGNVLIGREKMTREFLVLMTSLIGIFLFESIFESRSRYLYTFVPIYIVAATVGFQQMTQNFKKRSLKLKTGVKNEQK